MMLRDPKTQELYRTVEVATHDFCREVYRERGILCGKGSCPLTNDGHCVGKTLSLFEFAALTGWEIIEDDGAVILPSSRNFNAASEIFKQMNNPDNFAKADTGKPRPTLVPPSLVEAVTAVREHGTKKYGDPENWRKVEPQRYRDALYRHWLAYLKGGMVDEESGLSHLWHIACNVAFLIELEGENT